MDTERRKPVPLSMLAVVCDREKRERIMGTLSDHPAFFHLLMLGKGTANSRILGYLGLGETEKAVTLHFLPTSLAIKLQQKIDEKLDFKKPGHGISFITEIKEGCYHKPVHIEPEAGGETMQSTSTNDLIFVVLNRGYTEEVMEAARAAGATGGTVLHAKGCGLEGAEKFFGVTIQPEKETIMIVTKAEATCAIMQAIAEKHGPGTDASAVSFSLPVTNVKGVGSDVPQEIL